MILGIDLGTTNSSGAVWKDGKIQLIPNVFDSYLTPSVVSLETNGEILVGQAARERIATHPDVTVANFKRLMGTDKVYRLGKLNFRPEELSSFILRSIKKDAELFLGEPVTEAIITVPAYFNDNQRKATKNAGELAGLRVERLLNEPTAAALAYGLHERQDESCFLVFDLGGGTFDVSVLELFEGIMEVHASAGDNFLGGEDFVTVLAEWFHEKAEWPGGNPPVMEDVTIANRIRDAAEKAKKNLTEDHETRLRIQYQNDEIALPVTRTDFEMLSSSLLEKLRTPVERALRDSRIRSNELDTIVLVGGATRMPMIRNMVTKMFGRFPVQDHDPDLVVAMGAAVQGGLKARDKALNEVVMTDVCPYSLGIEVVQVIDLDRFEEGLFLPIIERNVVVPVSRVERLYTVVDNQSQVVVKIYQGESRFIKNNIYLGKIAVSVPRSPAGEEAIDVRFLYDINGILEVEVSVVSTEKTKRIVIEENPGVLTRDQIQKRLKALEKLKIHPRDDQRNKALLYRAERMYQECLKDVRQIIGEEMITFQAVLNRQDPREIRTAYQRLEEILNHIENEVF